MGLAPRREEDAAASAAIYKAGAGVLKPVGSSADGTYLKGGSGVPASQRASALAQRTGYATNARAVVQRPALADGKLANATAYGASDRSRKGTTRRPAQKPRRAASNAPGPYDEVL